MNYHSKALQLFLAAYQPDSVRLDYLGPITVRVDVVQRLVVVTNGKLTKRYKYEELG